MANAAHFGITIFPRQWSLCSSSSSLEWQSHWWRGIAPLAFHGNFAADSIFSFEMMFTASRVPHDDCRTQPFNEKLLSYWVQLWKAKSLPRSKQEHPFAIDLQWWSLQLQSGHNVMLQKTFEILTCVPTWCPVTVIHFRWNRLAANSCQSISPEAEIRSTLPGLCPFFIAPQVQVKVQARNEDPALRM